MNHNNVKNFNSLIDTAIQDENLAHMRPVIMKEILHYDILFSLDNADLLDDLTFQGGTCLRLCYGSYRFSEDLDFAGGKNFSSDSMHELKDCIERYLGA